MRTTVSEHLGRIPPALLNKPVLYDDLHEVMSAFQILSSARTIGNMPNPIAISEMILYHQSIETGYELQDFLRLLKAADFEYLKYASKKYGNSKAGRRS